MELWVCVTLAGLVVSCAANLAGIITNRRRSEEAIAEEQRLREKEDEKIWASISEQRENRLSAEGRLWATLRAINEKPKLKLNKPVPLRRKSERR